MPTRVAIAVLTALLVAGAAGGARGAAPRANDGEWLAYGRDGRLDNAVVSPTLRPSTVPDLREQWRAQLDGTVVASPLVAGGIVYAATEAGSVYALSTADGHVVWQQTTGTTVACDLTFGISSTGAIDRDRDDAPFGDQLVKLTPDLRVVDSDHPPGIDPEGDQDFGSAPLLFQPHGCPPLAAANNKNGVLYIWDRTNLAAGPLTGFGVGDAEAPFVGQPSWSSRLQTIFDSEARVPRTGPKTGNGVVAIKASYLGCHFEEIWQTAIGDGNQAPPLVVGNVVFA